MLAFYPPLARLLGPVPYAAKFLLIVFLGIHVPLLTLVTYIALRHGADLARYADEVVVVLVATLAATAATLAAVHALLEPVHATVRAVQSYLGERRLLPLPGEFQDAAGVLMRDVGYALRQLEDRLRQLEAEAGTDYLTGALSRRAGELALQAGLAAGTGAGGLVLVKIDLDRFKEVNDRHGHAAGDACLRRLAAVAREVLRAGDWLARWGGDEFVAGVRGTAEEGRAVADRLRRALARVVVRLEDGREIVVSASVGAAEAAGDEAAQALYARADAALYRAKGEGRRRGRRAPGEDTA